MRKTSLVAVIGFLIFLIIPLSAYAYAVKSDNSIMVGKNEVVDGNFYAAGQTITVDGTVDGDVICAANTVNINGTVEGDVICAAQSININGQVKGSVRAAGNSIDINGIIAENAMTFGASIHLGENAEIGREMLIACDNADIKGKIGRDLYGAAAKTAVSGEISRNVRLKIDDGELNIADSAVINGSLTYTSNNQAKIAQGAQIKEGSYQNLPKIPSKREVAAGKIFGSLFSIFSALVVGLVLITVWRDQIIKITDKMLSGIGVSIGWGIILMFITPIISILLLFTIIGIPLALILAVLWLIALYASKILAGIMIGRKVLKKIWERQNPEHSGLIWAMIIGIIIVWLACSIPLLGWMLCLAATWWGLGGTWIYLRSRSS